MSSSNRTAFPWVHDESDLKCPRCGSNRIARILDSWSRPRGVQMLKCTSCGKKFYERGYDDYRPTFIR